MKNDNHDSDTSAIERKRTFAMAMSAWDLERTRKERNDTPRARIVMLRAHKRLTAAIEAQKNIPPQHRSLIEIQDESRMCCLLIHGINGSPADLESLADHLFRSGMTVYAMLLPEHGNGSQQEFMWRACFQDVKLRFSTLKRIYRKVNVVGYGFGATLAIHLAANEPVASLALLSPALVPRVSFIERLLFRLGIHRVAGLRPRFGWTEDVLGAMKKARTLLSRLRLPIYAAQCDDDERVSPLSLRILQKNVRHKASRFKVFPTGGHAILQAHGEPTLYQEILKFFQGGR
jgi:esterase/lipase